MKLPVGQRDASLTWNFRCQEKRTLSGGSYSPAGPPTGLDQIHLEQVVKQKLPASILETLMQ